MSAGLTAALRACARGLFADEAAVELILAAGWCDRRDFTAFIHAGLADGGMASIDWGQAIQALDDGELPCSGGEQRMLRLAASLGGRIPVSLRDTLIGLDEANIARVASSVRHAGGHRPAHLEEHEGQS
jgi:hypothetical protein